MVVQTPLERWRSAFASLFRAERILVLGVTPLAKELIAEIEARPRHRVVVGVLDERNFGPADVASLEDTIERLQPHRIVVALAERRGRTPMRALLDSP
jgi:hypothetical protein